MNHLITLIKFSPSNETSNLEAIIYRWP